MFKQTVAMLNLNKTGYEFERNEIYESYVVSKLDFEPKRIEMHECHQGKREVMIRYDLTIENRNLIGFWLLKNEVTGKYEDTNTCATIKRCIDQLIEHLNQDCVVEVKGE
jgi:hypothetical protein